MKITFKIACLLLVCFTISPIVSIAQEVIFSARAAATEVGLQDPFEIQFSIQHVHGISSFQLPPLNYVQVLSGPSKNIQYHEVNGERTVSLTLTYVMKARQKGNLQLEPATAVADGHTIHSNKINIRVVEGSTINRTLKKQNQNTYDPFEEWLADDLFNADPMAMLQQQQQIMRQFQQRSRQSKPSSSSIIKKDDITKNIFFLVSADKRNVFRGEQINVSYKLYTRLPMEINITKTPDLQGFWSQDFKLPNPPQPTNEIYQGKEYQVFEIKRTAIFPTQTGKLTLDQAKAEGVVRLVQGADAQSLFDNFFGSLMDDNALQAFGQQVQEIPIKLQSEPIVIQVNELPNTNKPSSFQGAVGQFTIDANINKTVIKENEAATLTLKISGTGNLKLINIPNAIFPSNLNVFEPKVNDSIVHTPNYIAGYKEIQYTFSPNNVGRYTIPSLEFSFFDPETKSYKILTTPTYPIQVNPNDAISNVNTFNNENRKTNWFKRGLANIWSNNYWHWALYALVLLALLIFLTLRRKKPTVYPEQKITIKNTPTQISQTQLSRAEHYLKEGNQASFYLEISKALWLYLSNKLEIPLAKLSHDEAEKKLHELAIPNKIINNIFQITQICETALYSPNKAPLDLQQLYSDSVQLIEQLDELL